MVFVGRSVGSVSAACEGRGFLNCRIRVHGHQISWQPNRSASHMSFVSRCLTVSTRLFRMVGPFSYTGKSAFRTWLFSTYPSRSALSPP